ncbi:MAG TPA: hypothetical protein PK855_04780 [Bacteroidales bacterium]|nr:hypothetical protein [Bacteroidales bacterium]
MKYLAGYISILVLILFSACAPKSGDTTSKGVIKSHYNGGQPKVVHTNVHKQDTTLVDEVQYYPSGKKQMEGRLVNGQRDGLWKYYYEDGTLWSEGAYKNGIRHGKSKLFYPGGQKKMEGTYKDGNRNNDWIWWDEDGNTITESEAIAK